MCVIIFWSGSTEYLVIRMEIVFRIVIWGKAYRDKFKNKFSHFLFSDFQSHHPLSLLLLHVNYIQKELLSRRDN